MHTGVGHQLGVSLLLALAGLLAHASTARCDVRVPAFVADHMVLQREMPVNLWGWAAPGERVAVTIAGQTKTTPAGADGVWRVRLEPMPAGGPHVLRIEGENEIVVNDVLIGEVWLCSGQSNMEWRMRATSDYQQDRPQADTPLIRTFVVEDRVWFTEPQQELAGRWIVCSPDTVGAFSGVAYYFARKLHAETGLAVALLDTAQGGTRIESFTCLDIRARHPEIEPVYRELVKRTIDEWTPARARAKYEKRLKKWETRAENERKKGKTPTGKPIWEPTKVKRPVLKSGVWNGMIAPLVGYTLRGAVWYQGESNGFGAWYYRYQLPIMIEDWRRRWGQGDFPFGIVQLHPVANELSDKPGAYTCKALIREAALLTCRETPNTGLAVAADAGDPHGPRPAHPPFKKPVGERLALWALHTVYGRHAVVFSGPLYKGHRIEGDKIVIEFEHTDGGLVAKGDSAKLAGFAVAGADRKWYWADARRAGNTVLVSSPAVGAPVAVRYGWANVPIANLYNGHGLPAATFRTDDWPTGYACGRFGNP